MYKDDPFWKDDVSILTKKYRLIEFIPTADMTVVEKLNAITRLTIYLGVLLTIFYSNSNFLYIPLIGMAFIYMTYQNSPFSQQGSGEINNVLTQPTVQNPFMNVLLTEYTDNPTRPPAADVEDPNVKNKIDEHFKNGLYRDVNDIWDKGNSQRQFYTNPSTTIPNDRDTWMKWCWNTPYTCKDGNLTRCLKYENLAAGSRR